MSFRVVQDHTLAHPEPVVSAHKTPRRTNAARSAILIALWALGEASGARAQSLPQIDLNQFRPSELATDGFAVSSADGQGHLRFGVQLYMDFARNPLEFKVVGGAVENRRLSVVHSQLTGHLMWSLGLWDRLVFFMDLPYTFILDDNLSQGDVDFLDAIGQSQLLPNGRGLGDLYVGARGVLFGNRDRFFQLAAQATLTANTASAARPQQTYLGEPNKSPHVGGWFEALGTFNIGDLIRIPLNFGYKTAFGQEVPSLGLANQFTFGGGPQIFLGQGRFMLTAELFGRTAAATATGFGGREESPVEILGGFKYFHPKGFTAGFAGTGGVTSGYGNPDWRLIGMLAYTMPEKKEPVDTDGDGIIDSLDACPNDPEDFDGFQDEDGCPDLDNDADGILDVDDACPNEPGPPENNGCPDLDRDGDGVPDRLDDCPDEPGPPENHGCPLPSVVIENGQVNLLEKIYFEFDSAKLQERSFKVLDGVAEALNAHPEIPIVRVEGHTDSRGKDSYNMNLSQRRAESVVRYLVVEGGVDQDRLIAEGFGETRPLVPDATTDEEFAQNRRVEFHIAEVGPEGPNDESGER